MQKCVSILWMSWYLKKVPKNLKNFLITFFDDKYDYQIFYTKKLHTL